MTRASVLLLAGTHEARSLAGRLWDMPGIRLIASLAGVTSNPKPIAAETRAGGFGGAEGLAAFLRDHRIAALVDATHPFAARMPWNAKAAAEIAGIPRLRLIRPEWDLRPEWLDVASLGDAARTLPSGARVFLATGRQHLAPFLERSDCQFLLRSIEPPGTLPSNFRHIHGHPGPDFSSEFALLSSHQISHLVARNSGGPARAKLDAADGLGIRVILVARPLQPDGQEAHTVAEAVAWLRHTVGF